MLADWVSFCRIDDHVVFLDTRRNRYLALSQAAAAPVLAGEIANLTPKVRETVARYGWLVDAAPAALPYRGIAAPTYEIPYHHNARISARFASRVLASLIKVRLDLWVRSLQTNLDRVAARNRAIGTGATPAELNKIVADFLKCERILPAQTCLLRSLTLHRLLAQDGHASEFVFGVKLHPFEAHCWLQRDDQVINDTIEQVGRFVPIRAVR
ncbi:lasso peptide biosynthesis B2 protein [Novosphingobium sp. P6W]|uniref:lasso peptide biosynthesis B2 protein n=1 Tax=Novosphingobium sp. P6W TaxID=1609758 RepID=UPI0005C3231E|nr:lasso peptide biosynthesis B2 protein [Novosphingobium sp. P6W]AXB80224.1 lasso peptide biosynthesis B2 protein [Novosphingobium sp. P6W]KIS31572.1 hypothetical protein TQ38_15695 [Novosphingobium sp. P6W]